MKEKENRGGKRINAGPKKKMVEPIAITIDFEKATIDALRKKYGKKLYNHIRQVIDNHLHI